MHPGGNPALRLAQSGSGPMTTSGGQCNLEGAIVAASKQTRCLGESRGLLVHGIPSDGFVASPRRLHPQTPEALDDKFSIERGLRREMGLVRREKERPEEKEIRQHGSMRWQCCRLEKIQRKKNRCEGGWAARRRMTLPACPATWLSRALPALANATNMMLEPLGADGCAWCDAMAKGR